jgi:hypothetical protein
LKFSSWLGSAAIVGVFTASFLWETDLMWFEEGFAFGLMATMWLWGWRRARPTKLHPLYLQNNPGIGLVRLAFWASIAWCVFTLAFFGDPSIRGIWYIFYIVLAVGGIKVFGIMGAKALGVRLRVDVYERKNFAAALLVSAFILSTGLIAGGSMWGSLTEGSMMYGGPFELLPSYYEGTWISPWFFMMGWVILFLTMKLWFIREKSVSGSGLRRDRSIADGRAAATYCLGCAIPLTDAVAGDYYGLADSFIGFAAIAFPVLVHEVFRPPSVEHERDPQEPWYYVGFGFLAMILSPIISSLLGFR